MNKEPIGKILNRVSKSGKEYQTIIIGNQRLIAIDNKVFSL